MTERPSLRMQTEIAQSLRQAQIVADVMDTIFPSLKTEKVKAPTKFAYLFVVEDNGRIRCVGTNYYGPAGLDHTNQWAWIVGHLVNELGCDPDTVHCEEAEDREWITVDGKRVAYLEVEQ